MPSHFLQAPKGELKENESMKYEIDDFEAKITEEEIE